MAHSMDCWSLPVAKLQGLRKQLRGGGGKAAQSGGCAARGCTTSYCMLKRMAELNTQQEISEAPVGKPSFDSWPNVFAKRWSNSCSLFCNSWRSAAPADMTDADAHVQAGTSEHDTWHDSRVE